MLLLVTLALVVASAALLIVGFVQDALGYIYLSMLCAGVAALALFVFARLARRRSAVLAGAGLTGTATESAEPVTRRGRGRAEEPAEEAEAEEVTAAEEPEEEPVAVRALGRIPEVTEVAEVVDEPDLRWRPPADTRVEPTVLAEAPAPVAAASGTWGGTEENWEDWGDEIVFPIEDYDELRVAEILPLLSQLEADELQEVRDREMAGKARATIIDRIDDRLGRAGLGPAPTGAPPAEPETREAPVPAASASPVRAPRATKATKAAKSTKSTKATKAAKATKAPRATKAGRAVKATAPAPAPAAKATRATKASKASKAAKTTKKAAPEVAPAKRAAKKSGAARRAPATAGAEGARKAGGRKAPAKRNP